MSAATLYRCIDINEEYQVALLCQQLAEKSYRHVDDYILEVRERIGDRGIIVVGDMNDQPIGMSVIRPTAQQHVVEIGQVIVSPSHRGQGVGTFIMGEALAHASSRDDAQQVLIHTANHKIHQWAAKKSFQQIPGDEYLSYWEGMPLESVKRAARSEDRSLTAWRKELVRS